MSYNKLAGHYGISKTKELIKRRWYWGSFSDSVGKYVKRCKICSRNKSSNSRPSGLLYPVQSPNRPWGSLSVDFITDLPNSSGFNAIMVVVDRMSKMAEFFPCQTSITSKQAANIFLKEIFSCHGLPDDIISDCGTQFFSSFMKNLFKSLGIKSNLSSSYHPQSDGQTERVNQVLEQYLRCYISENQDDWFEYI